MPVVKEVLEWAEKGGNFFEYKSTSPREVGLMAVPNLVVNLLKGVGNAVGGVLSLPVNFVREGVEGIGRFAGHGLEGTVVNVAKAVFSTIQNPK